MNNNTVIKLNNQENYYIIAITQYLDNKYYITNHLTPDKKKLTDEFVVFKEFIENNQIKLEQVEDDELIYNILSSLGFIS